MFLQMMLFTNDEMVADLLGENENKYYYEADSIPSTYTLSKSSRPPGFGFFSEGPPRIFTTSIDKIQYFIKKIFNVYGKFLI